jgi:O-antigen/teichoic acid export membrane protein
MDVVTYYVVPFEIVARLSIIPISLSITLFPAFSTLKETKDRYKLGMLFAYSIKYILLILGPIVIVIELFAKEILQIWLGAEFAMKSPIILQLLAFAVLINSLGQIPFALLQGLGRPDVPAKFHLFELPVYTVGAWLLINHWGIVGAAVAWTIRVTLDAILLYMATFKLCQFLPRLMEINFLIILMLLLLLGTSYGLKSLISAFPLFAQLWLFVANLSLFAWFIWKKALDTLEKYLILKMIKLWWR